jgi:hypothetical protein
MAPFSKIVGGSLFAQSVNANDLALETNDFAAQFALGHTPGIHLPLAPQIGTSINCSAVLAGRQALRMGYADFGGQSFQKMWYDGALTITAGSVLVPSLPAQPIRLIAAFKISGNLVAYPSDPAVNPPPPASFQYNLTGAGNVTVRLTAPVGAIRHVTSYYYLFA